MDIDQNEFGDCNMSSSSKVNCIKDNLPSRVDTEQDLEKLHQRLLTCTEDVRKKYHESCRQMISELRPSHLDEFADVLIERQRHVLQDREELIMEMGEKLVHSLCSSLDKFWEDYDVANRLAALEMLKEQYKKFEGNTWNVFQMDPLQRTLPLRMRYNKVRLHYLEKQLAYQHEQLKDLLEANLIERSRINDMEELRKSVLMNMECCTKNMEQMNSTASQLTRDVLSNFTKNLD